MEVVREGVEGNFMVRILRKKYYQITGLDLSTAVFQIFNEYMIISSLFISITSFKT